MKNSKKTAVLYARSTSFEISSSSYPVGYQLEELRNYCKESDISVLVHFYDVQHGDSTQRPEYAKMMRFLEKNQAKINMVIFLTKCRFRNVVPNATESNIEIRKMMCMEIEPRAVRDPYFLPGTTEEEMQVLFDEFKQGIR